VATKDSSRAKNIALHQLSVSGRSEGEVRQRLRDREVADEAIEAEIAGLLSVGLIDARALARDLVDQLRTRKKLGDQAIRHNLARRKIAREIIDEVLADSPVNEDSVLVDLATARARSLSHLEPEVALRRLTGFLQRRGYQGSRVFEVAKAALSAQG
jgi:regulatory protein